MLKLHRNVGHVAADDPRLDDVWRYAASIRLPVVVHAGHADAGTTEPEDLAAIRRLARRRPDAVVIIAHCAYPAVEQGLKLVSTSENVYAETFYAACGYERLPVSASASPLFITMRAQLGR